MPSPPQTTSSLLSPISVVIPTYRRPQLVAQAVESALAQGPQVHEVIVVDDCPDGSAADPLSQIQDVRVLYRRNPTPSGGRPGLVRNLGWNLASGRIVHFLDDDDLVPADHYRAALESLDAEPDVGVVFGRIEPFGAEPEPVAKQSAFFEDAARRAHSLGRFGTRTAFATEMTFNPVLYVGGAALIRRECIASLGGFDTQMKVCEDTDFFARAMSRFGARFLDRVTLRYRIGPSITRSPTVALLVQDAYVQMHRNCRREWGRGRFLTRKILARTLLRR